MRHSHRGMIDWVFQLFKGQRCQCSANITSRSRAQPCTTLTYKYCFWVVHPFLKRCPFYSCTPFPRAHVIPTQRYMMCNPACGWMQKHVNIKATSLLSSRSWSSQTLRGGGRKHPLSKTKAPFIRPFSSHWTSTDGALNPERLRVRTRGPLIGIPFICIHNDYRRFRSHSLERPYAETQLEVIKT